MPKKRATRGDPGSTKPKQLRKRLHKAEDQLQDAEAKRDRAQARVDALSIIADEIRAQMAEVEAPDRAADADGADQAGKADSAAESNDDAASSKSTSKAKAKADSPSA